MSWFIVEGGNISSIASSSYHLCTCAYMYTLICDDVTVWRAVPVSVVVPATPWSNLTLKMILLVFLACLTNLLQRSWARDDGSKWMCFFRWLTQNHQLDHLTWNEIRRLSETNIDKRRRAGAFVVSTTVEREAFDRRSDAMSQLGPAPPAANFC